MLLSALNSFFINMEIIRLSQMFLKIGFSTELEEESLNLYGNANFDPKQPKWCWRRFLTVPWTARRSNQFIVKEVSPGCSLEGLFEADTPILWPPDVKS